MQNQQEYSNLELVDLPSDGPYVYEPPAAREANLPEVVSPAPHANKDAEGKIVNDAIHNDERKGGPLGVFQRRRPRYLIFTLIALIVVGTVLGAALGTTLNRRSQSSATATNPPSQGPASQILRNSSLTATNLADQNGRVHRRVIFQDVNNAVIVRQWDSQNSTWETRNLTEAVHLNPATPDIDTYPGTPLASASLVFRDNGLYESWVWYLDSSNQIKMVGSVDILYSEDHIGVNSLPERFVAGGGSRLAAAWQRCPEDCMGSWIVVYQAEDGLVNVINGSGSWHLGSSFDRAIAMGSSLAMTPQLSGSSATGLAVVLENLLSSSTGEVIRMGYGMPGTDGQSWVDNGRLIYGIPAPSEALQFASTVLLNFTQSLSLILLPNGTVSGCLWNTSDVLEVYPSIHFSGGPNQRLSAIAMTLDAMFYAISEDAVLEY